MLYQGNFMFLYNRNSTHPRTEALGLGNPVVQGWQGRHHKEGPGHPHLDEVAEDGEGLGRLAQPHLVGKQAVDAVLEHYLSKALANIFANV